VKRTLAAAALVGLYLGACAQIEQKQLLAEPVGQEITVPVGGAIATINKQKDLPNVFGRADIYGRKVDTGFVKIVYRGRSPDGSPIIEQVDVDVQSNASVFTRMPSIYTASSQANVSGSYGTVYGHGSSSAVAMSPHQEQTFILPPREATFTVPKGKTLSLPTGNTIEFVQVEPHQVTYRITGPPAPR